VADKARFLPFAAAVLLVASCGGANSGGSTTSGARSVSPARSVTMPPTSVAPSVAPSVSLPAELEGSEAAAFETTDGVHLEGRLFGSGTVGVILAHGTFEEAQGSWYPFAHRLATRGYRVLTFDFRGFCPGGFYGCSGGALIPPETWHDVAAATEFLFGRGVTTIFLMGSSLGAHTILWAAAQPGVDVAGVIPVSAPELAASPYSPAYDLTPAVLARIDVPKLFLAGRDEPVFADEARSLYADSQEPKRLVLLPSGLHGSELLSGAEPSVTRVATRLVLQFIAANS
jgi:pimeloyl-ACP methyl ester carboxylesterase